MCNKFITMMTFLTLVSFSALAQNHDLPNLDSTVDVVDPICIGGNLNVCFTGDPATQQPITVCWTGLPAGINFTFVWLVDGTTPPNNTTNPFVYFPTTAGAHYIEAQVFRPNGTLAADFGCIQGNANLAPTVTVQDQCVCTGGNVVFTISAQSNSNNCCSTDTAQLFVSGPNCFFFSSSIPLDNTPIQVPVADFASAENAGCYFVSVIDSNGCAVVNQPVRLVVVPCCPLTK